MFDIKAILKAAGVEETLLDTIADNIKMELPKSFVSKEQYSKKVNTIDTLNNTIADLEAKANNTTTDQFKDKYETLQGEYEQYKTNIEIGKVNATKNSILVKQLEKEGFNPKMIKLLSKEVDLEGLEIEGTDIKGWEEIVKPLKENYSDFISTTVTTGTPPTTPPHNIPSGKYTREQIENMTSEQIMANYEQIKGSLAEIK